MNLPSNFLHIALVGPPCSGKSVCYDHAKEVISMQFSKTDDVIVMFKKEGATDELEKNPKQKSTGLGFQFRIFSNYFSLIEEAVELARNAPDKKVILVSDRGCVDAFL